MPPRTRPLSRAAIAFAMALAFAAPVAVRAQQATEPPLRVALVADGLRGRQFEKLLTAAGMRVRRISPDRASPGALRMLGDVVVYDWPQVLGPGTALPLGELARWDRPTVFVGLASEHLPPRWGLPTSAQLAAMSEGDFGPEIEIVARPAGATVGVWRQGNLAHFASELAPDELGAADRAWFNQVVTYLADFVIDRPIVRYATQNGEPLPAAEVARRVRIAGTFARYGHDVWQHELLDELAKRVEGIPGDPVRDLLEDLVPDGPVGGGKQDWAAFVGVPQANMCWDALSQVWRVDPLMDYRIGWAPKRGRARADIAARDAKARDLVAKVIAFYGGAALGDLGTFSCWSGNTLLAWDRRNGLFRTERHSDATGRPTRVSVVDTAMVDRPLPRGSSGRLDEPGVAEYIAMLECVFLPALLSERTTGYSLFPPADKDGMLGLRVLSVLRPLAGGDYLLRIDPATGAIVSVAKRTGVPAGRPIVLATTTFCGPLRLPQRWDCQGCPQLFCEFEQFAWNPELPDGFATITDELLYAPPR